VRLLRAGVHHGHCSASAGDAKPERGADRGAAQHLPLRRLSADQESDCARRAGQSGTVLTAQNADSDYPPLTTAALPTQTVDLRVDPKGVGVRVDVPEGWPSNRPENTNLWNFVPPGDAQGAYLNALRWVKTGDARHRDKAIAILNDWARTFRTFSVASGTNAAQVQLEAAWMLPVWVSAAEIIRHYNNGEAGWAQADITTFNGFIDRQYTEAAKARTRVNNWAVSAGLAMMAAGAYQDNPTRYAAGLQRVTEMIPLSVFSSGEVNELKDRDCTHPQYNLEGLAQAAEIAVIQAGDTSVWLWKASGETTPRLAKGLEYMAKSLQSGSGVRNCKGQHLEAGYMDIAVNGYMNRGVPIPAFQALAKARRPDGASMQFLGFTTATHGRDDY
jgi:hypothetical protein